MRVVQIMAMLLVGAEAFTQLGLWGASGRRISSVYRSRSSQLSAELKYDAQGYLIKPRDWFNGLSSDPGNSLDDPRAVPPVAVAFAKKIKAGTDVNFAETLAFLDEHYQYFAVPFQNGDQSNAANVNTGAAKIFSFGLMTKMSEKEVLTMFGEIYRDLTPTGTDHANIRAFLKSGWKGVSFPTGLAIASKLQMGDTTAEVEASQAAPATPDGWSFDSESFIP